MTIIYMIIVYRSIVQNVVILDFTDNVHTVSVLLNDQDVHQSRSFKFVGAAESVGLEECDNIVFDQQLSEKVVPG